MVESEEIWVDIAGFEGYYIVSTYGRVYDSNGNAVKETDVGGYKRVYLTTGRMHTQVMVHELVAGMFIGCDDHTLEVNHKNCIKDDNTVDNLEWVTHKDNMAHAARNRLMKPNPRRGAAHHSAKLTDIDVLSIRELVKSMHTKDIAHVYGVHNDTIRDIIKGRTWTHI